MPPRSFEIANLIIFGWYIPTWFLMGAILSVSPAVSSQVAPLSLTELELAALLSLRILTVAPPLNEDHFQTLV